MKRLLLTVAALAATAFGCSPSEYPGNIVFHWTLAGSTCAQQPLVTSMQVSLPGQSLEGGGLFDCDVGGFDGVELYDFVPDEYTYAVDALDEAGKPLFRGGGSVKVNGTQQVDVDLVAVP